MNKNKLPLILRTTDGRLHPLLVSVLVFLSLTSILTILFAIEGISMVWGSYEVSIEFPLGISYVVFITRWVHNIHEKNFHELLEHTAPDKASKEKWLTEFSTFRPLWKETLVALSVGILHAGQQGYGSIFTGENRFPVYQFWGPTMIISIWVIVSHSSFLLMRNMTLLNRLSREVKVDLLNMDKFMPLTKSGVWSIISFIGVYTILFMKDTSHIDLLNPSILIIAPSVFFMVHTPLKGVRKRVIAEKERELKIIDAAIEGDHEALKDSRIGANLSNINVIDLISYRRTIQNTFEIPVNIPTASRFVFYLFVPLLTWIAASMVDKVIDYFLK